MADVTLIHGDCLEEMRKLPENSVDAVVTDPPYGLRFMGADWDHGVPGIPFWTEARRDAACLRRDADGASVDVRD